jgi:hypothetical protein
MTGVGGFTGAEPPPPSTDGVETCPAAGVGRVGALSPNTECCGVTCQECIGSRWTSWSRRGASGADGAGC